MLPPQCPACDTPVEHQGRICAGCFSKVSFVTRPFCEQCGVPFASTAQVGLAVHCPACTRIQPLFRRARAALRYDAQARQLILPLKHADRVDLAPVLGAMMIRAGAELLGQANMLLPVPLHRRRLLHRKYNQAAMLALAIGRQTGHPVHPDWLMRMRRTNALDHKTAGERAWEVADSFRVRPAAANLVKGKVVLLIDDVMTSGATANACAEILLQRGAAAVDVLLAARVPDPRLK